MEIEEKVKDLEPKLIQWLTFEKEVMEEVLKRIFKGIFTSNDWDNYFIGMVEKYGNDLMSIQLRAFIKVQESYRELMGLNTIIKKMKESPLGLLIQSL